MVMCPKQQQNANWSQVEIEKFIVKGRNLPRTNSTKSETQNILAKKQQNEHTPAVFVFVQITLSNIIHMNNECACYTGLPCAWQKTKLGRIYYCYVKTFGWETFFEWNVSVMSIKFFLIVVLLDIATWAFIGWETL